MVTTTDQQTLSRKLPSNSYSTDSTCTESTFDCVSLVNFIANTRWEYSANIIHSQWMEKMAG